MSIKITPFTLGVCLFASLRISPAADTGPQLIPVGVAKLDITPSYPIRLSGYGNRRTPSEGIEQSIWAKALAIGADEDDPLILITVDNCGVPWTVTKEVVANLYKKVGIQRERVAICSSHTHCAPMLTGVLPLIFGSPIPADQQRTIDRYTRELTEKIQQVALAALADRRPGRLDWAVGKVSFAINRRSQKKGLEGPVDHSLPMLRVVDGNDKLRAIFVRYTCHAVALFGDFNRICGDWPGYAQQAIERNHPGCIALVAIGCAGDQKPNLQSELGHARQHGEAIAHEVGQLLEQDNLKPLNGRIRARLESIELPFDTLPTRAALVKSAERSGRDGFHARAQLERLDRGAKLPASLAYPVQTWTFGDDLAMVNLAGEVVIDYAIRLDREFDRSRLWVNAYTNDVPCYIPSRQVLSEGGYEPARSMLSYDRPTSFAPEVEDLIVDTIQRLLPAEYFSADKQVEFPPPQSPESSRHCIQTRAGLRVELVASEPLVVDPVAIDFGVDGRLWVAEYLDYPTGVDQNYQPGGRIKYLTDTDADGRYDKATVLLDNVPFPTGLMEWRGGVLIASAPNILYAKDTDGDGTTDVRQVLFTGFETDNYQSRVNGFRWGLDNFVHGSSGRRAKSIRTVGRVGGQVEPLRTDVRPLQLGSRDYRMDPDAGIIEAVAGSSQNARIRDDWGNWFGSTAGRMLFHYPLSERYLHRNPHVATPSPQVLVPAGGQAGMRLFPISRTLTRFNNPLHFNQVTSACGPAIYRDQLLGTDIAGDVLVCEPVHNVVTRRKLTQLGMTFQGHRVPDETRREFLASADNWFRPVQLRTGPDGALWVVDMYRFVIEHPRWIGPERLRKLDIRAGEDKGRIYRICPVAAELRPIQDWQSQSTSQLATAIDVPNGTRRDLIHRELLHRGDKSAAAPLRRLVREGNHPAARLQALCVLDGLGSLTEETLQAALGDGSTGVRRHAIRLSEGLLDESPVLAKSVLAQRDTKDPLLRGQLAMSLGEWPDPRAGRALAQLAFNENNNAYSQAAILSSVIPHLDQLMAELLKDKGRLTGDFLERLIQVAIAVEDYDSLPHVLRQISTPDGARDLEQRFRLLAGILDQLDLQGVSPAGIPGSAGKQLRRAIDGVRRVIRSARTSVLDDTAPQSQRVQAIRLVGRGIDPGEDDTDLLLSLLSPQQSSAIQASAAAALGRQEDDSVVEAMIKNWRRYSPATRSHVLDELFRRRASLLRVVRALRAGDLPSADVDASRRSILLNHRDHLIRDHALSVFNVRKTPRQQIVQDYQPVLGLQGSSERGKQVFAKHCAKCHRLDAVGHEVGPDLMSLNNRSSAELLIAILDPNQAVEPRYQSYVCITSDGRVFNGTLSSETATSITLLGPDGKQQVLLRSEIDELSSSGKSLMPEGVEKDLRKQDLADLFSYLETSRTARKRFPQNHPTTIRADSNGVFHLLPANASIYGPTLVLGQPVKSVIALTQWKRKDDHAVWEINVEFGGQYDLWLDSMCDKGAEGNEFVVQIDGASQASISDRTLSTVSEGNWYRSRQLGTIELTAGKTRITIRSRGRISDTLFHVRAVTLVFRAARVRQTEGVPVDDSKSTSRLRPGDDESGFVPLFNGRNLDGWQLRRANRKGYIVENGLLISPADGGGYLFTKDQYGDFSLRFEFRLSRGANNGVAIRAPLVDERPAYQGIEIQILDNVGYPRKLQPTQYHGSIYDVVPAKRGALRPVGEWNEQEIVCHGRRIIVTVNDKVILDADLDKITDAEVLEQHPGLQRTRGHIGLLGHGSRVEFRDIRIKQVTHP